MTCGFYGGDWEKTCFTMAVRRLARLLASDSRGGRWGSSGRIRQLITGSTWGSVRVLNHHKHEPPDLTPLNQQRQQCWSSSDQENKTLRVERTGEEERWPKTGEASQGTHGIGSRHSYQTRFRSWPREKVRKGTSWWRWSGWSCLARSSGSRDQGGGSSSTRTTGRSTMKEQGGGGVSEREKGNQHSQSRSLTSQPPGEKLNHAYTNVFSFIIGIIIKIHVLWIIYHLDFPKYIIHVNQR